MFCIRGLQEVDMKKVIFWATVLSGIGAAYFMYKRGVPAGEIANEALKHPIGSLVHEVQAL